MFSLLSKLKRKIDRKKTVRRIKARGLSFLSKPALSELYDSVSDIERKKLHGDFIEAGCALGGSAIVIAQAKSHRRPFYIYDVFGQIPPPTEEDGKDVHERYRVIQQGEAKGIDDAKYYGYETDLKDKVRENLESFGLLPSENNIYLVEGLFEETLRGDGPVAFAHLDGDWYQSTMTCLENIVPRLVPDGLLIIDDYDSWSGCRKAVDEYFAKRDGDFLFAKKTKLHIRRAV